MLSSLWTFLKIFLAMFVFAKAFFWIEFCWIELFLVQFVFLHQDNLEDDVHDRVHDHVHDRVHDRDHDRVHDKHTLLHILLQSLHSHRLHRVQHGVDSFDHDRGSGGCNPCAGECGCTGQTPKNFL